MTPFFLRPASCVPILLWGIALSSWLSGSACAQIRVWQPGQKEFESRKQASESDSSAIANSNLRQTRTLVTPAVETKPAMKYRFWVAPIVREPGSVNAKMGHATLLYLTHPRRNELDRMNAVYWQRESLRIDSGGSARTTPADEMIEFVSAQRDVLRELYAAAKLRSITSDPTAEGLTGLDAIDASFPHVQTHRALARLIQEDVRIAIANRDFDGAIEKIAAGFRLAEFTHDGFEMNLITKLVSIAISGIMLGLVEEMSAVDGAPNMYWALASLPESLWDLRTTIDGEMAGIARIMHPALEPIPDGGSKREMQTRLQNLAMAVVATNGELFDGIAEDASEELEVQARLISGALILLASDQARIDLGRYGYSDEQVAAMDDTEASLRGLRLSFLDGRDRIFKWAILDSNAAVDTELQDLFAGENMFRPANILLGMLTPAIQAATSASKRTESHVKRLMLVQAIRGHVAVHGSLPEQLEMLDPLPAVEDPETHGQFEYELNGPLRATIRDAYRFPGWSPTEIEFTASE